MGLYGFKGQFVPYIELGLREPEHPHAKLHTIRAERKHSDKPGDTMHLYYGLRTKQCRLIARVPCVRVERVLIWPDSRVMVAGAILAPSEREQLARRDGFPEGWEAMWAFWQREHFAQHAEAERFQGCIYHWREI